MISGTVDYNSDGKLVFLPFDLPIKPAIYHTRQYLLDSRGFYVTNTEEYDGWHAWYAQLNFYEMKATLVIKFWEPISQRPDSISLEHHYVSGINIEKRENFIQKGIKKLKQLFN